MTLLRSQLTPRCAPPPTQNTHQNNASESAFHFQIIQIMDLLSQFSDYAGGVMTRMLHAH
ncbi:hypothetical protein HMI56_002194 [Coelomomyces lativittatus]|nr:hypothetical protein HMI56_002194 [Coelomomyces lativittatus]